MPGSDTAAAGTAAAALEAGEEVAGATLEGAWLARLLTDAAAGRRTLPRGLRIRDSRIEGAFDLEALALDFPVYLKGCIFAGPVVLRHARMMGLFLEGAVFHEVVDARDSAIGGQVVLRRCDFHRPVLMRDCRVDGQVNLLGARFRHVDDGAPRNWMEEHAWGQTVSFARTRMGSLKWEDVTLARDALVDLTDAAVGSFLSPLTDGELARSWPAPGRLLLDGLTLKRVDRVPVSQLLRWLRLTPHFAPSAFRSVAAALADAGLTRSEEIVVAALRREEVKRIPSRARRLFFRAVFGISDYGLRAGRVMALAVLCFTAAVAVAQVAWRANWLAPASGDLIDKDCYYLGARCGQPAVGWHAVRILPTGVVRYVPRDYPDFSPIRFTAERTLPLLESRQRDAWDLSVAPLGYLHRLLAALSLFLGGIFIGTVSGLLRPKG